MKSRIIIFLIVLLAITVPASAAVSQWTTINGAYTVVKFNGTGSTAWTMPLGVTYVDYLVVAGGGGGSEQSVGHFDNAGGGGGGVLFNTLFTVNPGSDYTILVGDGGEPNYNGGNSSFSNGTFSVIAIGGGHGGNYDGPASSGGCGGGAYHNGVAGTGLQGYNGGAGISSYSSGGGGGMGADGNTINGGNGVTYWDVTYGGGGVGIDRVNPGTGTPGTGGGGDEGQDGTDGLGGGGGAATSSGVQDAGSGGSGVVIIRYLTPVTGPTASFTGTPLSGTAPLTVQFTDSSSNSPTSWSWNFGDSQTSSLQNPSHTYTTAGSYTVSLNATNGDGFDTETKTGYITVSAPATSTVSIVGSGNITQANDYTTLDLTLDYVPLGFSGYNVNITVDNPAIAEITGITFPTWAQDMNTVGSLPGTQNILLKASDVNDNITAGMSNVPLGTITFRGLSYGSTTISLSSANFDDENGYDMPLSLTQGSIFVDEPLADPLIFDITPAQAYNNASVTILLNGTGFLSDMMVVNLTKPGETDITADPVTVPSRFQTNCVFNINGAADGVWNITLMRTSDEKTTTFLNGFTVVRPLIPIDGMTHDPTDLNEDGKYEDLNGNGQLDYADVNLFAHVILNGWIFENEPVELFDFSGNGSLTYEDVITLFLMVS